jgi:hypothetical protein
MDDAGVERADDPGHPRGKRRRMGLVTKILLWTAAIVVLVAVLLAGAAAYYLHRAEPMLRASLVDTLQKRFHSRVELDSFHVSVLNGFSAEGAGLRIWLPGKANLSSSGDRAAEPGGSQPEGSQAERSTIGGTQEQALQSQPWITVQKFRFHVSWRILPGEPIVVSVIHVDGAQILLPPKEDRPHLSSSAAASPDAGSKVAGSEPGTAGGTTGFFRLPPGLIPTILVRRVEAQNVYLAIERKPDPAKPQKAPLDFNLSRLVLIPDGRGGPMAFDVELTNPKPIGLIHATGHVGPWKAGEPGLLPLDGDYRFDHADLSTIKGIAGILASTGHFRGTLQQIQVNGETTTPDFRLERVSKATGLPLTTNFDAIVNGENGDTILNRVDAMLDHTHFICSGKVIRQQVGSTDGVARHGHDIELQVHLDHGRIEDVLRISANAEAPFMTGNLTLNTAFHLPPGQDKVMDRLKLNGQFHLSQARFSSEKVQGKIEQLSLRGQGKPEELKTTDPTSIQSEMRGHFTLGGGSLTLPDLDYEVPGAQILVKGTYGLKEGTLKFVGNARMKATLSQMVGGWKGLLLKPADRYLKHNGAGADVPIHLNGTRKDPEFGVDFDRVGKPDAAQ